MYLPIMLYLFAGNVIRFERESYRTTESVGDFTEVRLVADKPFAEDTSVNISFEDISATGVCNLLTSIQLHIPTLLDKLTASCLATKNDL